MTSCSSCSSQSPIQQYTQQSKAQSQAALSPSDPQKTDLTKTDINTTDAEKKISDANYAAKAAAQSYGSRHSSGKLDVSA